MLEIRIRSVEVRLPIAGQGFVPNRGLLPEDSLMRRTGSVDRPDAQDRRVRARRGGAAKPFWGVMGVAPPVSMGRVPSGPPNIFGGNLDNRDLGAGSTLYLPVHVPGALLSIGDGHAVQGYGEVCLSAVEASLKGEIQVVLHKGRDIRWPRAETATHYITMGLDPDLDEAAKIATREMIDFLCEEQRADAGQRLHVVERGDGSDRHPGGGRHQGHSRHDAEGHIPK